MAKMISFRFEFQDPERLSDSYLDMTRAIPESDLNGLSDLSSLHLAAEKLAPEAFADAKRHFLGADVVELIGFHRNGEARRFEVDATYSGRDGGQFGDAFFAVDVAEAEFQAAWTMTANQRESYGDSGIKSPEDLVEFLDAMSLHDIHTIEAKAIPDNEFEKAFLDLFKAVGGDGDLEQATAKAREVLEAREFIPAETAGPKV